MLKCTGVRGDTAFVLITCKFRAKGHHHWWPVEQLTISFCKRCFKGKGRCIYFGGKKRTQPVGYLSMWLWYHPQLTQCLALVLLRLQTSVGQKAWLIPWSCKIQTFDRIYELVPINQSHRKLSWLWDDDLGFLRKCLSLYSLSCVLKIRKTIRCGGVCL